MKKYIILIVFPFLLSCKKEKEVPVSTEVPVQKKDSITVSETDYKLDKETIFGVYQLTNKDMAICIPVQFGDQDDPLSKKYENFLVKDSIPWIYGREMKDYKYYDTLSVGPLYYNKRFEDAFKKEMKESYFVYGTKSFQQCSIKRVVFHSTECGNDYIAYILNVDKNLIGNPLIASEKEIPLKYGDNYSEINKSIKKSAAKESTENNYGFGNYNPIVYGNYKNLYFTYYDDFKWHDKKLGSNCQFPERAVFELDDKEQVKLLWSSEMDLLGLPCL
ncbi:hypothetical protein [Chryseobacterium jejuense]|uniref:Lipoprotein n=1 Tax=Chryseobacterium jejuense TaxID=445960 RepID=A0A2X2XLZ9_CHRJE|nr:hypothetical protein [Chryseobacterium jejuense]SDI91764.1 hypothetical protein SAMN05421542_2241 [Chryseobacterium jejuense]SQB27400.1 Uncharacterised protein [Chryseobacterium jejuense]